MNRLERLYRIDQLRQERTVVPLDAFRDELEGSLATFKRDLEHMRDRFSAPVVWDATARAGWPPKSGTPTGRLVTGDRTHFGPLHGRTIHGVTIHSPRSLAAALLL
jgi:hypothetical protein